MRGEAVRGVKIRRTPTRQRNQPKTADKFLVARVMMGSCSRRKTTKNRVNSEMF
jgi:hypothetical protein